MEVTKRGQASRQDLDGVKWRLLEQRFQEEMIMKQQQQFNFTKEKRKKKGN